LEGKGGGGRIQGRCRLKKMNDVKLDLNLGVKCRPQEMWIEQKEYLSRGKPRPSYSVIVLNKKKKEDIICGRHVASM
jgi:hypothetical protein